MGPTLGNTRTAWLSEERRAQMEQSIQHLLHSEISRDEGSRAVSADDPRRQLEMFDKLSLVLNACRNRLVPINRVPQDIMYRIFSIVLRLENIHKLEPADSADYPLEFVDQRGRLRLVSRIWDSFVVSTPGFWTLMDIQATNQEMLTRRIERAQQGELCITHQPVSSAYIDYEQLATFLCRYLDRIRTLRLDSGGFAGPFLENPFPVLRTLEMRYHGQWFTIAQDRFPQLCTLHLSHCLLPRDTKPLNTLRILHIHDSANNKLNQILGFLTLCPELEELTISSEDVSIRTNSQPTTVRLEKLRRLELRNLELDVILLLFGAAQIPNFRHAGFTLPIETADLAGGALEEILGNLQVSSAGSGSVELSVFSSAVTCTVTEDGRSVEVRPPGDLSSVSEECADTLLEYLKPDSLRIAVELEDQNRVRWLNQVFERNNVIELRVRLGSEALQISRAVIDYLAPFGKRSEQQAEEKTGSESSLLLPSLQTLVFENGVVDIPHLLRMVASRVNSHRAASAHIQKITLISCDTRQWPDLSSSFRDLGVDLVVL